MKGGFFIPDTPDEEFKWRQVASPITVTSAYLAQLSVEYRTPVLRVGAYDYLPVETHDGYDMYRAFNGNWDEVTASVGSTADPAAGAQPATITVPAKRKWKVLSFTEVMVTDANVADRYAFVQHGNLAGAVLQVFYAVVPVTASLTQRVSFGRAYPGGVVVNNGGRTEAMPEFEVGATDNIRLNWLNIQAGDNGAVVYYQYKEVVVP